MESKCSRKLDLAAPLLSTRRSNYCNNTEICKTNSVPASRDTSNMVPFSWEKCPGEPKDDSRSPVYGGGNDEPPPPKLPPCQWHPTTDDGWDGDDDNDNDDDDDDVFSDAIDMFSLSESSDIGTKKIKDGDLGLSSQALESGCNSSSPNFIIRRFLPAANALAFSSSISVNPKNLNGKIPRSNHYSYSPPKGCGLETFFQWRVKPKLCSSRSLIRQTARPKPSSSSENPSRVGGRNYY